MGLFRRSRAYMQPAVISAVTASTPHVSAYRLATSATPITTADEIIGGDAVGGAFSATLPTAVGKVGHTFIVKRVNAGGNAVTVATTSAQTIDGAATYALSVQWQSVTVASDGANWLVI